MVDPEVRALLLEQMIDHNLKLDVIKDPAFSAAYGASICSSVSAW